LYRQVLEKDIKHGELMKDIQIQPNTKEDKNDDTEEHKFNDMLFCEQRIYFGGK
jgi:hypothetical protein